MPAVAGLRGTGDWATDERPKNFREMILWRQPSGSSPIFGLMAKVGKESTNDPEFAWWDESQTLVRLQVNGSHASGLTTINVDSADPSASAPANTWGTARHLIPGDILQVEPATSGAEVAGYTNELILVTGVLSDTQFVVQRGFAGTTPATIGDNVYLLLVGSAFSEGSASPSAASRNPTKFFNYCQIFKTAYELTNSAQVTKTRTGDPLQNDKKRKAFDHSRGIEQALIWGKRSETTGANGKPLRTTGGIRTFLPTANINIFAAAVTPSSFLDAVYPVFNWDTPAGDTRIGFCGNGALNELQKVLAANTQIRINYQNSVKVYGMEFNEFRMPQGRLLIKTHPLFNQNTIYTKSMLILDFSAIRWRYMPGRDTKFQDNIQGNDEDTRKGQWMTEGGVEVRYGGLTCAYLGNISAT